MRAGRANDTNEETGNEIRKERVEATREGKTRGGGRRTREKEKGEKEREERRDTCRERGKRELLYNWRLHTSDSLIVGASPVIRAARARAPILLLRIGVLIISLPI